MLKTFKEMCDDESICEYCSQTDFGEYKEQVTPSGYSCCEGMWCKCSYDKYLDERGVTENIIKYASKVKLLNKEDFNE